MTSSITNNNPQRISSLKTFLASDEAITIIPVFTYDSKLSEFLLTQNNIGPFIAGESTTVPLWLAIYLRKRNLCRLVAPSWLNVPFLKNVLQSERVSESFSTELPFRYMEISRSIIQAIGAGRSAAQASGGGGALGSEEVPQVEMIRVLLEDISTVRMDKIRRSVHTMSAGYMSLEKPMPPIDVTGIGAAEMAAVKPFLESAFQDHLKIVRSGTESIPEDEKVRSSSRSINSSRRRRTLSSSIARRNEQEAQANEEEQEQKQQAELEEPSNDNEEELIEPTADESENDDADDDADDETNDDVSRLRVRRYR